MRKSVIFSTCLLLLILPSAYADAINVILSCPASATGFIELKSTVTYTGNSSVKCIYEYSPDGKDFFLINESTDKNSGYSVYWQTSNVENGQYVIRVTATDLNIMHANTRLMDINNSGPDGPVNPNTYWDSGFGELKYKSSSSFIHYGPRSELKVTYGAMPDLVKERLSIRSEYTTDNGGMTKVILTSREIPTELIEKEEYIGQIYSIELSLGGDVMSVSYDLTGVKASGTEAYSNTFDQRLKALENKVDALENLLSNPTDESDLSKFVTVTEMNNAISSVKKEMGGKPPDITANSISDLNVSVKNLSRNYQTNSNAIKNLADTVVKKDDLMYKYSMYLGVIALLLSIFSFVINFKPISKNPDQKPKPRPLIPSTPRERKQNKDNEVKNINLIQRGYYK